MMETKTRVLIEIAFNFDVYWLCVGGINSYVLMESQDFTFPLLVSGRLYRTVLSWTPFLKS